MHFLEPKYMNFKYTFIEISSLGSNWQYVSIVSNNGLAPSRRQVIIWANVDTVHRCIYVALGGDELSYYKLILQVSNVGTATQPGKHETELYFHNLQWLTTWDRLTDLILILFKAKLQVPKSIKTHTNGKSWHNIIKMNWFCLHEMCTSTQ